MATRRSNLIILIHPEDNVVILTKDGQFYGVMAASEEDLQANSDLIQEQMSLAMKRPECQEGYWLFKIKHKWLVVQGEQLPIPEEGEEHDTR